MTGLILLTAFDSLLFCALTSILRSPQGKYISFYLTIYQIHLRSHQSPGRNSKDFQEECIYLFIPCRGRFLQLLQYLHLCLRPEGDRQKPAAPGPLPGLHGSAVPVLHAPYHGDAGQSDYTLFDEYCQHLLQLLFVHVSRGPEKDEFRLGFYKTLSLMTSSDGKIKQILYQKITQIHLSIKYQLN